jgi:rhodanese-related sulfurtransferase
MYLLKKYKAVIIVVLPILILVLLRSLGPNHFKSDAKRWAEPSVMRSNIITRDQTGTLSGEKLIIRLGEGDSGIENLSINSVKIPADSVLSKNNLNRIRNHNGPVLLFSTRTAVSARVWMVLSQMGYKNIFILTDNADNEVLKYKFRPDTLVKPEL